MAEKPAEKLKGLHKKLVNPTYIHLNVSRSNLYILTFT